MERINEFLGSVYQIYVSGPRALLLAIRLDFRLVNVPVVEPIVFIKRRRARVKRQCKEPLFIHQLNLLFHGR